MQLVCVQVEFLQISVLLPRELAPPQRGQVVVGQVQQLNVPVKRGHLIVARIRLQRLKIVVLIVCLGGQSRVGQRENEGR